MTRAVLHVTAYYPPHVGGQEHLVQGLAEALVRRKWRTEVLTSDRGGRPGKSVEEGVSIIRLKSFEFGHTAIMPQLSRTLGRMSLNRPILHIHIGQAFVPEVAYLVSLLHSVPYVVQLHTDLRSSGVLGGLLPIYRRTILRAVLRRASSVLIMSPDYEVILRKRYGYRGRVSQVRNGIADDWFDLSERRETIHDPLRLLFVGRLGFPKNCAALVDAVSEFPRQSIALRLIGTGDDEQPLRDRVLARGLVNVITFGGSMSRARVIEEMRAADAIVIPSLYESQPLVLLESMALGIPIIASDVTGLRELASNCSIQCDPNSASIANAIRRFVEMNPDEIGKMVGRAREKAERHRWSRVISQYESIYLDGV